MERQTTVCRTMVQWFGYRQGHSPPITYCHINLNQQMRIQKKKIQMDLQIVIMGFGSFTFASFHALTIFQFKHLQTQNLHAVSAHNSLESACKPCLRPLVALASVWTVVIHKGATLWSSVTTTSYQINLLQLLLHHLSFLWKIPKFHANS